MSTKANAIVRKRFRIPTVNLEFLLYLLPISILLGTNFPSFSVGDRIVFIGTTDVLIVALVIGSFLRILMNKGKLTVSPKIFYSVVMFSSILLISVLFAILRTQTIDHIESYIELGRWMMYLSVFFIICILVKTKQQIKNLLIILLSCTIILIAVSLWQAITFDCHVSRIYGLFISGSVRAGQALPNPNVIGAFFMISGLYLIAFAMDKSLKIRLMLWTLVILNTIVLFQTLSRSAMLGFLVGVLILSCLYRKPSLIMIMAGLLAPVLLLSERVQQRLAASFDLHAGSVAAESILTRFYVWKITLEQFPNHLFFGVGFGAFQEHFGGWGTPDNYFLEILATTGLVGFCVLIFLFWRIIGEVIASRNINDAFFNTLKKAYIASIFAFLIASVFAGLLFNPRLLGIFWLLTGLTLKGRLIAQRER